MSFTVAAAGGNWLSISPSSGSLSAGSSTSVAVSVNAAGLSATNYSGTITVTATGATGSPASVGVSLTVSSTAAQGTITASGNQTVKAGTALSIPIGISLNSGASADALSFGVQVTASGAAGLTGTLGFSAGSSLGSVIASPGGSTFLSIFISGVSPALTGSRTLGTLNLTVPASAASGDTYTVHISSPSGSLGSSTNVNLTSGPDAIVTVANTSPSDFTMSVSPLTATVAAGAPATYTVSVSPSNGFAATVALSCSGTLPAGASCSFLPASLVASGNSTLTVTTTSATPAGTSTVNIAGTGGGQSHSVSATLSVSAAAPGIGLSTIALNFSTSLGVNPTPLGLTITNSGGGTLNWSAAAMASGGSWLSVSPASGSVAGSTTAGSTVSVAVNAAGLAAGNYSGTITITATGATSRTVQVTLAIGGGPQGTLGVAGSSASPGSTVAVPVSLSLNSGVVADSISFGVQVSATGGAPAAGALSFTASPDLPRPSVSNSTGTVSVAWISAFNPALSGSLTLGTISFAIPSSAAGGQSYTVHVFSVAASDLGSNSVSLTAGSDAFVSVQGATLDFTISVSPPSQTVTGGSSASYAVTVGSIAGFSGAVTITCQNLSSGAQCAALSVQAGSTGTLTVSTSSTSGAGSNSFTILGASAGPLQHETTAVLVVLSQQPIINLSQTSINFSGSPGANPPPQGIGLSNGNSASGALNWTAAVSTNEGGNWLAVTPASGVAPSTLTVSATSSALAAGTYHGSITISAANAANSGAVVAVTLVVSPSQNAVPIITSLSLNTYRAGDPAFIMLINGQNFALSGAKARWNGSDRDTKIDSSTILEISVLASDVAAKGTAQVTVFNPSPGGGVSNPLPFTILDATTPLTLSPNALRFNAVQGSQAIPPSSTVQIGGLGGSWTASVSQQGQWLSVNPPAGTLPTVSSFTVRTDTTGLKPDIYTGVITVSNAGTTQQVDVTLIVQAETHHLDLDQDGILFTGLVNGPQILPAPLGILNTGQGSMSWNLNIVTVEGGGWLTADRTTGSSPAQGVGVAEQKVQLQVNSAQLSTGANFAILNVTSDAPDSPRQALALVNMLDPSANPYGSVAPAGLLFTAAQNGGSQTQSVTVASTGGRTLQFNVHVSSSGWLSASPLSGALAAPPQSAQQASLPLQITANPAGLQPGVNFGTIIVDFGLGHTQNVLVALLIHAAGPAASSVRASGDTACTQLAIVDTLLQNGFATFVSTPLPALTTVADNCGNLIPDATVTGSISGQAQPLNFVNLQNGTYKASWTPSNASNSVTITVNAVKSGLTSAQQIFSGSVVNSGNPLVSNGGVVNAATYQNVALAPGSLFSLFGQNIASQAFLANQLPLLTNLGNVQVTMANTAVPLLYAGPAQVNGQVPVDLPTNRDVSLVMTVNGKPAPVTQVTITDVQPGIFLVPGELAALAQGAILNGSNNYVLADPFNPAAIGDVIVIYCTGLGATTPSVSSGTAAPGSAVVNTMPTVTIGTMPAVVDFAGLAPGFVGLYQVNAHVPAGITTGSQVPVLITSGGTTSNLATIAVK